MTRHGLIIAPLARPTRESEPLTPAVDLAGVSGPKPRPLRPSSMRMQPISDAPAAGKQHHAARQPAAKLPRNPKSP